MTVIKRKQQTMKGDPGTYLTAAEQKAADGRRKYLRKRRLTRIGIALMVVGGVMAVVHWLAHLGTFGGQPPGIVDLVAGYPMAAVLFLAGAITAGQ
jgi:hypothetical protein